MTSSHHGPYDQGYTRHINGRYKEKRPRESKAEPQSRRSPGLELQLDRREVGIASNPWIRMPVNVRSRALYTPPVTPWGVGCKRSR